MKKMIYTFGNGTAEGSANDVNLLGGKGANLAEMSNLGLPVPLGLTITTEVCMDYLKAPDAKARAEVLDHLMDDHVVPALRDIKKEMGHLPLLSVRSGARKSMPGMMDTVLNVGLIPTTMDFWIDRLGEYSAKDCQRRLIQMYGEIVKDIDSNKFTAINNSIMKSQGVSTLAELTSVSQKVLISRYNQLYLIETGYKFPVNAKQQVRSAVEAVFKSWESDRAKHYRKMYGYSDEWGTAVTIQMMVFGNRNDKSCSGVLFTRDPTTGEEVVTGEYLVNAQGEDVVSGAVTPEVFTNLHNWNPKVYADLKCMAIEMENHYTDMQDMEFTVEDNKLYILQTRNGKRSPLASFVIAESLIDAGMITYKDAVRRLSYKDYLNLDEYSIDKSFKETPTGVGIPAAGNVVTGKVAYSSDSAVNFGEDCILLTTETTPDDIEGIDASIGILTKTGGATSHAAVVARSMAKTCVVGLTDLVQSDDTWNLNGVPIPEGSVISIDGNTGNVWVGVKVPVTKTVLPDKVVALLDRLLFKSQNMVVPRVPWDRVQDYHQHDMVYVDTYGLEKISQLKMFTSNLTKTQEIIINLAPAVTLKDSKDTELWELFGNEYLGSDYIVHAKQLLLELPGLLKKAKHKKVVYHAESAPIEIQNMLNVMELRELRSMPNIAEFLNAYVSEVPMIGIISSEMEEQLGGLNNTEEILNKFSDMTLIPQPKTPNRLMYDVLNTKEDV